MAWEAYNGFGFSMELNGKSSEDFEQWGSGLWFKRIIGFYLCEFSG